MDRLIYTVASGTKHIMDKQATTAQNLANVSTTGFRAQIDAFRAVPIKGDGMETRVMVETDTVGADFSSGALQVTGRELDVAVRGKGWIALQMPDGTEAYTRNGALQTSPNGLLLTAGGQTVAGEGGPITIPPETAVMVGADGTIATMPNGAPPAISTVLGRIKLVSPPDADMARGEDGLFRLKTNGNAPSDPQVVIASGTLESSNVNAVDAMVDMISLARSFETQMSLLKNAENNAAKASQLFALG
jgi:flagellar basal-body rod protein FlgF